MRHLAKITTILFIVPMLLLTACQEQRTEIQDDDRGTEMTQQEIEQFRSDLQAELQEIDSDLSQIEQDLSEATDEQAEELQETVAELRQERQEIEQELQQTGQQAEADWQRTRGDLQRRVDDLAVDVSRARMKAADTVEQFQSIAQEELEEIDRKMSEYTPGAAGLASDETTGDRDMAARDGETAPDATTPDGDATAGEGGTFDRGTADRDGATMAGDENEVQEWREERQQLAEDVQQLGTEGDEEFEQKKDELADAIADLEAEVRQAVHRQTTGSDFVQTRY